jgi:hypothetical protein
MGRGRFALTGARRRRAGVVAPARCSGHEEGRPGLFRRCPAATSAHRHRGPNVARADRMGLDITVDAKTDITSETPAERVCPS